MTAAKKLEPEMSPEGILSMLHALPVSTEPSTPEEDAIFAELEADVRAGRRGTGPSTEEIFSTVARMHDHAAE